MDVRCTYSIDKNENKTKKTAFKSNHFSFNLTLNSQGVGNMLYYFMFNQSKK